MNLNFAENLKHLRKEKGVTQEKLSEVLGVSAQSVSRWELAICYPDIEMLPAIANYFGTTVDALLSNDTRSKEQDQEIFYQTVNTLSNETTERIDFVLEYCRKYPEDDKYAFNLVRAIQEYAVGDEKKTEKYMPLLMKYVPRLLETKFRNYTIQSMATLCNEKELDKWLSMTPYNSGFSRRYCLEARAGRRNDLEEEYVQRGLGMFESLAVQLDGRYPDRLGPQNKAEFQKKILRVSRIIKRRTVANEACDAAHVSVNGRPVKASYDVKEGDIIEITFGEKKLKVKVLDVRDVIRKNDASSLYEIVAE